MENKGVGGNRKTLQIREERSVYLGMATVALFLGQVLSEATRDHNHHDHHHHLHQHDLLHKILPLICSTPLLVESCVLITAVFPHKLEHNIRVGVGVGYLVWCQFSGDHLASSTPASLSGVG